jgi:hypothetical protein
MQKRRYYDSYDPDKPLLPPLSPEQEQVKLRELKEALGDRFTIREPKYKYKNIKPVKRPKLCL